MYYVALMSQSLSCLYTWLRKQVASPLDQGTKTVHSGMCHCGTRETDNVELLVYPGHTGYISTSLLDRDLPLVEHNKS